MASKRKAVYDKILVQLFVDHFSEGDTYVKFVREDLVATANKLGLNTPKNLGDVLYSYRFRKPLPEEIRNTAPKGMEWILRLKGRAEYAFELSKESAQIIPNENLIVIKIPDATPEIIRAAALDDEQALLAIVRYNRLVDTFLSLTSYSLQNHLRTTVKGIGQIEIDEIYIGLDQHGQQYIIPVEAKGHNDKIGRVQTEQDLAACEEKWSTCIPVAVAVQFMSEKSIAMFALTIQDEEVRVAKEKHYCLVPSDSITEEDRRLYRQSIVPA